MGFLYTVFIWMFVLFNSIWYLVWNFLSCSWLYGVCRCLFNITFHHWVYKCMLLNIKFCDRGFRSFHQLLMTKQKAELKWQGITQPRSLTWKPSNICLGRQTVRQLVALSFHDWLLQKPDSKYIMIIIAIFWVSFAVSFKYRGNLRAEFLLIYCQHALKYGLFNPLHATSQLDWLNIPALRLPQLKRWAWYWSLSTPFLSVGGIKCDMLIFRGKNRLSQYWYLWLVRDNLENYFQFFHTASFTCKAWQSWQSKC
jgi:hypothetical protein